MPRLKSPVPPRKTHYITVKIECLDPQTNAEARDRLQGWLETFGHTACSHGFEFQEILVKVNQEKGKAHVAT